MRHPPPSRFVSEGPKGKILKSVQFSLIGTSLSNLALGDANAQTGQIDDLVVTDNGDGEEALASVVEIVYRFCARFLWARLYATGSTPARTRLCRMGINKYYQTAVADFYIFGQKDKDEREPLQTDRDYQALIVKRKGNLDLGHEEGTRRKKTDVKTCRRTRPIYPCP